MRLSFPPLTTRLVCVLAFALAATAAFAQTGTPALIPAVYPAATFNSGASSFGPANCPAGSACLASGIAGNAAGVSADASGNLYLPATAAGEVLRWNHTTGAVTVFGSGLTSPLSTAVDSHGGVYVSGADGSVSYIAQAGTVASPVTTSLSGTPAVSVALSPNGDSLFAASSGGKVWQCFLTGAAAGTCAQVAAAFSQPMALAAGPAGELYVADFGANTVYELVSAGGDFTQTAPASSVLYTMSGLRPNGVAVDASGTVYLSSFGLGTIVEKPVASVAVTVAGPGAQGITSALSLSLNPALQPGPATEVSFAGLTTAAPTGAGLTATPSALATDGQGLLLIPTQNAVVLGMTLPNLLQFPPTAVGSTSVRYIYLQDVGSGASRGKTFQTTNTFLNSLLPGGAFSNANAAILAGGAAPFGNSTSSACGGGLALQALNTGTPKNFFCEIDIAYSPKTAGVQGSLLDAATNAAAAPNVTLAVSGTGVQAIPGVGDGLLAAVGASNASAPVTGMAPDPSGNLYVLMGNNVYILSGGSLTSFAPATGLSSPSGIAFDARGDLFIADTGNGAVKKISAASVTTAGVTIYGTIATLASGSSIGTPNGIAVDRFGDVFVSDSANNVVHEIDTAGIIRTVMGSGSPLPPSNRSGWATSISLGRPAGLALDATGNLFVSDASFNFTWEVQGGWATQVASTGGALALDPAGNLYIGGSGRLTLVTSPGGSNSTSQTLAGNGNPSNAQASDDGGAAVAAQVGQVNAVAVLPISGTQPSASILYSDSTATGADTVRAIGTSSGVISAATIAGAPVTQAVNIANLGNDTINLVSAGAAPAAPFTATLPDSAASGQCANDLTLAPGASCAATVTYAPTAASNPSDSAVLSYNLTYGSAATAGALTVTATGTASAPAQTATTLAIVSGNGQSATVNSAYGAPLVAQVLDQNGAPMSGVNVTFSAPTTGADASFAGGESTVTVNSDNNGLVTSPALAANTVAGGFSVAAAVASPTLSATFNLTNATGPVAQITVILPALVSATQSTTAATATYDAYGNPVSVGNLTFTSSDTAAVLPVPSPVGNVSVTFNTAGPQTLTATSGTISGSAATTVLTTSVSFPPTPVNPTTPPSQPVVIGFPSGVNVGSISVVTGGYTNLDYTDLGTGTCATGAQAAGSTCTINVQFKPTAVGQRLGAVLVRDNSGNLLQTIFLNGVGTGSEIAFAGAKVIQNAVGGVPGYPTLDAQGNVYYPGDTFNGVLTEWHNSNGTLSGEQTFGPQLTKPSNAAFDGAGNLYYVDSFGFAIHKVPSVNGTLDFSHQVTIGTEINVIAVDGQGNLFFSGSSGGLWEVAANTVTPVPVAGIGNFGNVQDLAFDGNGHLYATAYNSGQIFEITNPSGPNAAVASVFTCPTAGCNILGVAFDPAGDLYYSDNANGKVYQIANLSGSLNFANPTLIGNFPQALGLAFDKTGNLYVGQLNGTIAVVTQATASALPDFGGVNVGATGTAQTESLQNIGNLPLNFSSITAAAPFLAQGGTCAVGTQVNTGATCAAGANFQPVAAGAASGALTLSDDAANETAPQAIGLSGTGNQIAITVTASSPAIEYGQAVPPITGTVTSGALQNGDTLASIGIACAVTGTPAGVGTYITSCSGNPTGYSVTFVNGSLSIGKAALTVTASSPAAITYGAATPTITGLVTGGALVSPDTLASIGITCSVAPTGAGTFATSCAGTPANYAVTYVAGSLTVNKAAITVTASSPAAIAYGAATPSITGTVTGGALVSPDTLASIGIACSVTPTGAGTFATSCAGTPANYTVTYVAGSLTVNKATITVTASSPAAIAYGAATPAITGTVTGGALVSPDTLASIGITCSVTPTGAGTFATSCAGAPANYAVTYVAGSLTVNKAAITVTASSPATITYGAATPAISGTVTGGALVAPDTLASIGITCSVAPTGAGTFATSCAGTPANYAVTYVAGSLTVTPAGISVTASSPSITYGQTLPAITPTLSSGTLISSDTLASIGITCSVTASPANAGTYPTSCSGTPANYSVTFTGGTLTINKADSATTWNPASGTIVYGTSLANVLNASGTGAVSYTNAGSPVTGTSVLSVGTYTLTATSAGDANHNGSSATFALTVTPAPLTVTVNNVSRAYGAANPTLTGTITGIVNSDNITASYATTADVNSPANTYPITATLNDPNNRLANYTVTNTPGTLTVTKADTSVTWSPASGTIVYGTNLAGVLTASGTGAVSYTNGGSPVTGASVLSVGTYTLTATSAGDANHNGSSATFALTVTPAPLTVTVANVSRAYSAANPTLTGTITGIVNSDNITASYATAADANSPANTYPITATLNDPNNRLANYTVTNTPGTLTVTKADTSVTWSPASGSIVYGTNLAGVLTASGTGAVSYTNAGSPVTGATVLPVGSYSLTATSAGDANDNGASATFTLTVTPAPLTVAANNATRVFGAANPAFTGSVSGAVAGDTFTLSFSTSAGPASPAGTYAIVPAAAGAHLGDYAVTVANGTLTVTAVAQTITFAPIGTQVLGTGNGTVTLAAVSSAGLPITYTVSGPATLIGNVLTITGPGTITVTANAAGNGNYAPAAPVSQSFQSVQGLAWGLYATSSTCGAINLNGNVTIDSFDSSLGAYPAGLTKANGNIGTNGNARLNGNVTVYGSLYDPNGNTRGDCDGKVAGPSLEINGHSSVTSIVPLAAPVVFPTPAAPVVTPPVVNQSINGSCGNLSGCGNVGTGKGKHVALAPGTYGDLTVNGNTQLDLSAGTYNFDSLRLSGNSVINLVSGPVVINLTYAGKGDALDVTGGTLVNNLAPSQFEILYAGTGDVELSGGDQAAAVVYAPNAPVTLNGNGRIAGTIVGATITDNGDFTIDYDRSLAATGIGGGASPSNPAPLPQAISFGGLANVVYGVAPIQLGASSNSGLPVTYTVSGPASISGATLTITGAGTVTVTAHQGGSSSYLAAADVPESFTVSPAVLTVTANNLSVAYGQVDSDRCGHPERHLNLTYGVTGFVDGDTAAILSGSPSLTTSATASSKPGTYSIVITAGTLQANGNYTLQFVNGVLTVTNSSGDHDGYGDDGHDGGHGYNQGGGSDHDSHQGDSHDDDNHRGDNHGGDSGRGY